MRVLVLGGGGTLGAFSAGAMCALRTAGWKPDAAIGSSAGSINLLRGIVGGPDAAIHFWTSLDWKRLVAESVTHDFVRHGILDAAKFRSRVDAGIDWKRLMNDEHALGFIVCDLNTGRVSVRGNRTERSAEDLQRVAQGSYALPPLFEPVRVGDTVLADGGLLQNLPLEAAMRMGATEIVYLCNVQVIPPTGFHRPNTLGAAARYLDIYFRRTSNVGFADARMMEGRYQGVPFLTIAPPTTVHMHSMASWMLPTTRMMKQLVRLGEACAREALSLAHTHGHKLVKPGAATPHFAQTSVG